MAAQYAFVMKGMTKTFPGAQKPVLNNISLQFYQGAKIGIVGPNGAGKSTLFNLILGEEQPDDGIIEWERGADFGYLPQESAPVGDETILQIATSNAKLEPADDGGGGEPGPLPGETGHRPEPHRDPVLVASAPGRCRWPRRMTRWTWAAATRLAPGRAD